MANRKISELAPLTVDIDGTEILPLVQGGTTKRPTVDQFLTVPGTDGRIDRNLKDKAQDVLFAKDYGAVGTGAVDDTAAISAALSAAAARGGGRVEMGVGTFRLTAPLSIPSGVTLRGEGPRTVVNIGGFSYAFQAQGSISSDLTNTLASNAAVSATSITLAAGKGANFAEGDYALLQSEAAFPEGGSANKRGEIVRVQSVSVDTLTLESPLTFTYNTADTARLRKITMVEDAGIENVTVNGNFTANPTFTRGQSLFIWCLRPRIKNVTFKDMANQAVALGGCVGAVVDGCQFYDLDSDDATKFGYSVVEVGPNLGTRVLNCTSERVRHGYTTVDSANYLTVGYGQPIGSEIANCSVMWPRAAGFDTHEAGYCIAFKGCKVIGGGRAAYQIRSVRTTLSDCEGSDCVGEGIYVDSSADGTFISGGSFVRTNTGTYSASDRRDRGCIFDNGPRTCVKGVRVELCGGPGIEAFTAAADYEYSNCRIKDPAQLSATNTYGIWVNASTSTTATICGNTIHSSDAKVTQGIRASNANTNGFAVGNRVIGSVSTPYNFGSLVQHQGNVPGGLCSVGNQVNLTIASDAINITSVSSNLIAVDGEGGVADNLATINGGLAGDVIYLKRSAANVITVKHGTGNIFLNAATDKSLGGSFDTLQLVKIGSNWVGGFLADV